MINVKPLSMLPAPNSGALLRAAAKLTRSVFVNDDWVGCGHFMVRRDLADGRLLGALARCQDRRDFKTQDPAPLLATIEHAPLAPLMPAYTFANEPDGFDSRKGRVVPAQWLVSALGRDAPCVRADYFALVAPLAVRWATDGKSMWLAYDGDDRLVGVVACHQAKPDDPTREAGEALAGEQPWRPAPPKAKAKAKAKTTPASLARDALLAAIDAELAKLDPEADAAILRRAKGIDPETFSGIGDIMRERPDFATFTVGRATFKVPRVSASLERWRREFEGPSGLRHFGGAS